MPERAEPILDYILTPDRLTASFKPYENTRAGDGSSADIYLSSIALTEPERGLIRRLKGRYPHRQLFIKVAKNDSDNPAHVRELLSDSVMLADPVIQYFAVASSSVRNTPLGTAMVVERASGFDITDPNDVLRLAQEDYDRIVYQIALVNARFHQKGVAAQHAGKTAFYRKEFDPLDLRPFADPPRVVLFDMAFEETLPLEGQRRVTAVLMDQKSFVTVLKDLFVNVSRSKLTNVQRIADDVSMCKFNSFARLAHSLDSLYDGKFSSEFRVLVGIDPEQMGETNRFSHEDFSLAAVAGKSSPGTVTILGKDGVAIEGLLPGNEGGYPFAGYYATEYLNDMIHQGLKTRKQIIARIMSKDYPSTDREDFLSRLRDGRVILDVLLDELERRGIITGTSQTSNRDLSLGEKILNLARQAAAAKGLPVSRSFLGVKLIEDDISNGRPDNGEPEFFLAEDPKGGFDYKGIVFDYLADQGIIRR